MTDPSAIFEKFCDALNDELVAAGCGFRVDRNKIGLGDTMRLIDSNGEELGWLPDHVDAETIAAFEIVLDRRCLD